MAFQEMKISGYEDNIKSLSDRPSEDGITPERLKEIFDGRGDKEIKNAINGIIDKLDRNGVAGEIKCADGVSVEEKLSQAQDGTAALKKGIEKVLVEKKVEIPASDNKFNKDDTKVEDGLLIIDEKHGKLGGVRGYDGRVTTGFIPIANGQYCSLCFFNNGILTDATIYIICYYDENKNFIETPGNVGTKGYQANFSDERIAYMRLSFSTGSGATKDNIMLFISDSEIDKSKITEYISYSEARTEKQYQLREESLTPYIGKISEDLYDLTDKVKAFDLIPHAIERIPYRVDINEGITQASDWNLYKFEINGFDKIVNLVCNTHNLNNYAVAFYTENDEFIAGTPFKHIGRNVFDVIDISEYANAKYFRISTRKGANMDFSVFGIDENRVLNLAKSLDTVRHDFYADDYDCELKSIFSNKDLNTFSFSNDSTFVGDELWCSNLIRFTRYVFVRKTDNDGNLILDENGNEIIVRDSDGNPKRKSITLAEYPQIKRFKVIDEGFEFIGSFIADFGHLNTFDYNPITDCLIFGNGANSAFANKDDFFAVVTDVVKGETPLYERLNSTVIIEKRFEQLGEDGKALPYENDYVEKHDEYPAVAINSPEIFKFNIYGSDSEGERDTANPHIFYCVKRDESGKPVLDANEEEIKISKPVYKVQAVWGDANCGRHNQAIVFATDVETGKLAISSVALKKTDGKFNGELKVIGERVLADRAIGVQGADYYGGDLYIGHDTYGVARVSVTDGSVRDNLHRFFDDDGKEYASGCLQGVCVNNKYEWWFMNLAGASDGTSKVMLKYHR